MFTNIGGKIKGLAKVFFYIGAISSILLAIFLLVEGELIIGDICFIIGPFLLVLGPVCSWASSLALYGFGELIEDVSSIKYQVYKKGE